MYAGPLERPHWEAREDASRTVLVALYLRDALGARDPSGLPRLLGTGLPEASPADDRATYWWMRWWISVVETTRNEPILFRDALAPVMEQVV